MITSTASQESGFKIHDADDKQMRRFKTNQYLAHIHSRPDCVFLLRRGWVIRYRQLRDGRRQITGFFLQGDFCDVAWLSRQPLTQAFKAVTDVEAVSIHEGKFADMVVHRPDGMTALCNEIGLQSAINAEHCLTLGRKTAAEKLTQLFSEISYRLGAVSGTGSSDVPMPLTQQHIADILGLTPIHVNRVMRDLRDAGIVTVRARRMIIPDLGRMQRLAQFDPRYLAALRQHRLRNHLWHQ